MTEIGGERARDKGTTLFSPSQDPATGDLIAHFRTLCMILATDLYLTLKCLGEVTDFGNVIGWDRNHPPTLRPASSLSS